MRRHGHLTRSLFLAADTCAALCAATASYAARFWAGWIPIEGRTDVLPARYLAALPVAVAVMLLSASLMGAYGDESVTRPTPFRTAFRTTAMAGGLLAATALLYRDVFQYSRLAVAFTTIGFLPAFMFFRLMACRTVATITGREGGGTRAVIIGGGAPAAALAAALRAHPWMGVRILGVCEQDILPAEWSDAPRIETTSDALRIVAEGGADEVYIALPADRASEVPSLVEALEQHPVDVRVVPDLGSAVLVNPHAFVLSGVPIVSLRERPLYGVRAAAKRALDVALALFLMLALAPILIALAILVRLTSSGPALFRQERMGLDGRRFAMWKYRTMTNDAEEGSGPVFTQPGDPRVTTVGRLLRRFSLDELPQLWNVVRGEMSLVGPRPEREEFISDFRKSFPGYMLRLSVRAGMTGWAQVHGLRGESSLEERLRYDLEYIDRWSLLLDVEILIRTAGQVLIGKNAY
jgi:exopolysaccharide biosynthesis polyprenyl glycosylphosphotransferase